MIAKMLIESKKPFLLRVSLHLTFWFVFTGTFAATYHKIDGATTWLLLLKDLLTATTIFYFSSYVIIPKWLMKGKYVLSLVAALILYIFWVVLSYLAGIMTLTYLTPNDALRTAINRSLEAGMFGLFSHSLLPFYKLDFIYLITVPIGLKLMQVLVNERRQKSELAMEALKLEAANNKLELAFLKSQLSPHFMFNSLNNIYILVKSGNPEGADHILKMSGIMSYLLYASNRAEVSLGEELSFLKDCIELEKLRLHTDVNTQVIIETDSERYCIVPLILFPFIENAFKHGPRSAIGNAWVHITITVCDGRLQLNVSNGVTQRAKPLNYTGGIGIENVKRRLELNYEKEAYKLEILDKPAAYSVCLLLQLE